MMHQLSERVIEMIEQVGSRYHRLVLVVGVTGTGKTNALREAAARAAAPLVNVNLELSRHLLDLTERRRARRTQPLLDSIVAASGSDIVLLDNTELLFDPVLQQDPLRLLRGLSRHRTVVASWNGSFEDGYVHYAKPGHPEYRRYTLDGDFAVHAEVPA